VSIKLFTSPAIQHQELIATLPIVEGRATAQTAQALRDEKGGDPQGRWWGDRDVSPQTGKCLSRSIAGMPFNLTGGEP